MTPAQLMEMMNRLSDIAPDLDVHVSLRIDYPEGEGLNEKVRELLSEYDYPFAQRPN